MLITVDIDESLVQPMLEKHLATGKSVQNMITDSLTFTQRIRRIIDKEPKIQLWYLNDPSERSLTYLKGDKINIDEYI